MEKPESEFGRQAREMTVALASLQQTMSKFKACAEEVQAVMLFAGHPELCELDDELDTLYRGQL